MFLKSVSGQILFESRAHSIKEVLEEAVSCGVPLVGIDLRGACLWGADLKGASFVSVDMSFADMRVLNLTGCSFIQCDLLHVDLVGAQMDGACFKGVDISYSKFSQEYLLNKSEESFKRCEGARYIDREGVEYLFDFARNKHVNGIKYAA